MQLVNRQGKQKISIIITSVFPVHHMRIGSLLLGLENGALQRQGFGFFIYFFLGRREISEGSFSFSCYVGENLIFLVYVFLGSEMEVYRL